jgi:putative Mn2+ efflux pump MntP
MTINCPERGNTMSKIILGTLEMVFYMACPVMGWVSYEFMQLDNWMMTYLSSGLSFLSPLLGHYAGQIKISMFRKSETKGG